MQRKKPSQPDVVASTEIDVSVFGAGDVEKILGIESWRLQKFLSGKRYRLSAAGGQLGRSGQGSRRMFRLQDVYRIGIANWLVRDGFAADFVSDLLQFIEDNDLISFGQNGLERSPLIGFVRTKKEPEFIYLSNNAGDPARQRAYYVLDLPAIIDEINRSIREYSKR